MAPPTFAPLAVKAAGITLADALPSLLVAPRVSLRQSLVLAKLSRIVGTGRFLIEGQAQPLVTALANGARTFLHFAARLDEAEKVTAKYEPFFDAVAARDLATAAGIARAARATANPGKEYPEDFLYMSFLMGLVLVPGDTAALRARLDAYQKVNPDTRWSLCHALLIADQAAFDEALARAVEEKRAQLLAKVEKNVFNPDEAATIAHVSTEVLAWLVLAEGRGLQLARDYPLAPAAARAPAALPPDGSWRQPEDLRELT
jgi:hypothetical protein